jgi:hypothetical protein
MLHTDMTLRDDFPALRALLWKRKGSAVHAEIHGHSTMLLAAGLLPGQGAPLEALERALAREGFEAFTRHAGGMYGLVSFWGHDPRSPHALDAQVKKLKAIAGECDAAFSAELVRAPKEERLERHLAARGPLAGRQRLWARLPSAEAAARYARDLSGALTVAGRHVLLEEEHFGPRLGLLAHRQGGTALVLTSRRALVKGYFSRSNPDAGTPDVVPHLRPYLTLDDRLETETHGSSRTVEVNTLEPGRVLKAFVEVETLLGIDAWTRVEPDQPLAEALYRIRMDLEQEARPRKRT